MKRDVTAAVKELVAKSYGDVFNRVIEQLAEAEIAERVKVLREAVAKHAELKAALAKMKPDQRWFRADGSLVDEAFSKAKLDEKKKLEDQLARLEKAIDGVACETPNYDALRKATAGKTPEVADAGGE